MYCPFMKKTKSFFDTAVKFVGAEAVTAVKLAVDGAVIEAELFINCFLRKACWVLV